MRKKAQQNLRFKMLKEKFQSRESKSANAFQMMTVKLYNYGWAQKQGKSNQFECLLESLQVLDIILFIDYGGVINCGKVLVAATHLHRQSTCSFWRMLSFRRDDGIFYFPNEMVIFRYYFPESICEIGKLLSDHESVIVDKC